LRTEARGKGFGGRLLIPPEIYTQLSAEKTPPNEITEKRLILLDLLRSINSLEPELQEAQKELRSPQRKTKR